MKKNTCLHLKADVVNSRPNDGYRYRRYCCRNCNHRWSTVEVPVNNTRKGKTQGVLGGLKEELGLSPEQSVAIENLVAAFQKGKK